MMMLGRILKVAEKTKFRVISIECGSARNSIPRSGKAEIAVPKENEKEFEELVNAEFKNVQDEYHVIDPDIKVIIQSTTKHMNPISLTDTMKIVNFLNHISSGVIRFSPDLKDLVETSMTIAILETKENQFVMTGACRSSRDSQRDWMYTNLESITSFCGYILSEKIGEYPGWQPEPECELTQILIKESKKAYSCEDIKVYSIHAGLECGIIQAKYPGIQCSSIGPQVDFAHSPMERVKISSILPCYKALVESLTQLTKI